MFWYKYQDLSQMSELIQLKKPNAIKNNYACCFQLNYLFHIALITSPRCVW